MDKEIYKLNHVVTGSGVSIANDTYTGPGADLGVGEFVKVLEWTSDGKWALIRSCIDHEVPNKGRHGDNRPCMAETRAYISVEYLEPVE